MNRGTQFLTTVIASAVVTALGNFIILYYFGGGGIAIGPALVRFALPGLLYAAVISILLGINAPLFAADFKGEEEKVFALLKKIGALPIKSIAYTVVLNALFLWIVIFPLGSLFGFNQAIKGFLYAAGLATGMAVGTLTYIIGDGLVSRTLMESGLVSYPRELRENRQGLKACIIPIAVALLAIGFTFSVTVLALTKAGLDFAAVASGEWGGMIATLAILFAFIVILSVNLKINASALYNSIIIQLENLSSGKKDLKRRITITSVDELGLIAGMMNSFCETVALGMVDIKSEQYQLLSSGRELAVSARDMDRAVGEISGKISQTLEKTGAQMKSVDEASQAIKNITVSIESLSDSINLQSRSVDQASSAVEEMVGNIASIGNVTEKMADHFKTVDGAAKKGINIQNENSGRVEIIVEQSKALQDANRIITSISAETNLLAMNAAIEAAHAGDVGRGFSVVAGEIRKLAENSARESKKINDELKQISATIDGIVKGTKLSAEAFGDVSERVRETENLVYEVNNAIKEQRQGTEQILDALKQMNGITTEVQKGSAVMREGSAAMLKEIGSLQNQSRDISAGMESLTREINAITEGAGVVSKRAADTNGAAEKIEKAVNGFEV